MSTPPPIEPESPALAPTEAPAWDPFAVTLDGDLGQGRVRAGLMARLFGDAEQLPSLGRYRLERKLGRGGMGTVYAADDPELGRKVAIKVLDLDGLDPAVGSRETIVRRLVREGQAAARLAHPNVVEVYDVGVDRGVPYIVMELVEGGTLGDWLAEGPHPTALIVDALVQSARGLAAAHRVGLLHRDFKPGNVLRSEHGHDARLRVADFGLALALGGPPSTDPTPTTDPLQTPTATMLAIAGTPAFMAPEQHEGLALDGRADQFAFCVTAWFAFYGRLPFEGSLGALLAKKLRHETRPPSDALVDPRIHAVIARGLAPDREQRWPDMDAIADALANSIRPRRRWWLAAAALPVAIAAVVLATPTTKPCSGAAESIAEVWSSTRRDELAHALATSPLPYIGDSTAKVVETLDDYAARWITVHDRVCEAQQATDTAFDRGMSCLERRRRALVGIIGALIDDPDARTRAVELVRGIDSPESCTDPSDDSAAPIGAEAAEIEAELGSVDALVDAGRYDDAIAAAEPLLQRATELSDSHHRIELLVVLAKLLDSKGGTDRARERGNEALYLAATEGRDKLAFRAAIELMWIEGMSAGDFEAAQRYRRQCEALLVRTGSPPRAEVVLARHIAALATERWDFVEARAAHERAFARLPEIDDDVLADEVEFNYAATLLMMGEADEAAPRFERAAASAIAAYGPDHPEVADALNNLASARSVIGQSAGAIEAAERALAIRRAALGPEDPRVGEAAGTLGYVCAEAGDHTRAAAAYRDALAVARRALGVSHATTATFETRLAEQLAWIGRTDEAWTMGRRGLDQLRARLAAPHGTLADSILCVAHVARLGGRTAQAIALFDEAAAMFRELGDADSAADASTRATALRQDASP